jgi:hypothetical protein
LEREGYRIRYPELADVPKEVVEKFSQRSKERDAGMREHAERHGIPPEALTNKEKALIVRNYPLREAVASPRESTGNAVGSAKQFERNELLINPGPGQAAGTNSFKQLQQCTNQSAITSAGITEKRNHSDQDPIDINRPDSRCVLARSAGFRLSGLALPFAVPEAAQFRLRLVALVQRIPALAGVED